jgi:virginiamycin B lyase
VTCAPFRLNPYGIKIDSDNQPWIVLLGTNRLATVDPGKFTLQEIELPDDIMRPRRLEIDADDTIWFVDYAGGRLGHYDPTADSFEEWYMPGGEDSRPYTVRQLHPWHPDLQKALVLEEVQVAIALRLRVVHRMLSGGIA